MKIYTKNQFYLYNLIPTTKWILKNNTEPQKLKGGWWEVLGHAIFGRMSNWLSMEIGKNDYNESNILKTCFAIKVCAWTF